MTPSNGAAVATVSGNDDLRAEVQKRTLRVVMLAQILGGLGLAAGISVGALLAEELLGSDSVAGLPTALFTLGSAAAAFIIGRLTQRSGRRLGLELGFIVGGIGAVGVVWAAAIDNVPLLFGSFLLYGAATAANLQARYAGTDLALPDRRGKAISIAMVATTIGAVAGPNLIAPLGSLASSLGLPELTGPFLLAAVANFAAGIALWIFLRPDPFLLAQQLELESDSGVQGDAPALEVEAAAELEGTYLGAEDQEHDQDQQKSGKLQGRSFDGVVVGATVMVLTQIAMVAIMTMTPVHMSAHHFSLSAIGFVISIHVAAMFLPSPVTGYLVDKYGRVPLSIASAVTLLFAGLIAAFAPNNSLVLLIVALALLGLGWNFGLIAGTAMIVDATTLSNRGRVQGSVDVLIALAGAGGGAASGVVMATSGFSGLSLIGGVLSLLLVPVLVWARSRSRARLDGTDQRHST
ncbi:MAG: MFS transporter [Candidatus Nanopelagicales bacterium]